MESHDVNRLAVAAQCHADTIRRYLRGERIRYLSELRITAGAKRLGLRLPGSKRRGSPTTPGSSSAPEPSVRRVRDTEAANG